MNPREKVRRRMAAFKSPRFLAAVTAGLYECADAVRSAAHESISRGSVSGKGHTPSAPGQPPNRDSGHLQAHIETTQPTPMSARVSSEAEYAAPLEFGTSRMEARPYLRPARDNTLPEAKRILRRRIKKALKS